MKLAMKGFPLADAAHLSQPWRTLDCSPTVDGSSYNFCPLFERWPITIWLGFEREKLEDGPDRTFYRIDFRQDSRPSEDDGIISRVR